MASVQSLLTKAGQRASRQEHQHQQLNQATDGQAPKPSVFDVWTHSYQGLQQNIESGAINRDHGQALLDGLTGDYYSSSPSEVSSAMGAQLNSALDQAATLLGLGDKPGPQGVLATVGSVFGLLTSLEQLISTPLSMIPFPALPAVRVGDFDIGLPHAHLHPPNLIPPNPVPIPLPSTGPVIPIPILSGANTTTINGMPAARCGDMGAAVWCGGYFPMYEIFLGSSSVWIEGCRAARIGVDITKHCIFTIPKPTDPPVGPMVGATVSASFNVIIGGVPMPSLLSLALGKLFGVLFKGLGKLARGAKNLGRRFSRATANAGKRVGKKMKPGFIKCRLLRAEPVNVVSGEVAVEQQDFELPWRVALDWTRRYGSDERRRGACGVGWQTPADIRLELEADGSVTFYDGGPGAAIFPSLPLDGPVRELVDGAILRTGGDGLMVRKKGGLTYHFELPAEGQQELAVTRVADLCGNQLEFVRHAGRLLAIRDGCGQELRMDWRDAGLAAVTLVTQGEPEPRALVRYEQDDQGDLVVVRDAMDQPYRFAYDDDHRLEHHTDRNGLTFTYLYDDTGRCVRTHGDGGLYDYLFEYQPFSGQTRVTDSLGQVSSLRYDSRDLIVEEVDALGGVTRYEYDAAGRTVVVVNPLAHRTECEYDDSGNLLRIKQPDGSEVQLEYDSNDLLTAETDPKGNAWRQQWDARGLLVSKTSPLGARWSYEYDQRGSLVAATDPMQNRAAYATDQAGYVTSVTDPAGRRTQYETDALGAVVARTDAMGGSARFTFDPKGRLLQAAAPSGRRVRCEYDGEDNLVTYHDEADQVIRISYSGLGEVTERINPDGTSVNYTYDTEQRLLSVTNERGQTYTLERDALGRIIKERDFWGQVRTYRNDAAGRTCAVTDALGAETTFKRDGLGRVVARVGADGGEDRFSYDPAGNLLSAECAAASVLRVFDDDDRLVEELQGDDEVAYEYDLNGNRTCRTSSNGNEVRYSRDALGNVTGVSLNGAPLADLSYDLAGRLVQEALPNQLVQDYTLDPDGRLLKQTLRRGERSIVDRSYRYDPVGNLVERRDASRGTTRMAYDPVGRVTEHLDPAGKMTRLLHDPAGDLLLEVHDPGGDPGARKATHNGIRYTYDARGNLVSRQTSVGEALFSWDGNGRLQRAQTEQGQSVTYGYDALGRRVFKDVDGQRTRYQWDGDTLLADVTDEAGAREFIFRPETFRPLASVNGKVCYYANDAIGLPHELVDEQGDVVWAADYDALGATARIQGQRDENPLRFEGQYFDHETGLCYNRHRYYDPNSGAFISQDPIGLVGGLNIYEYAPNPWSWSDPYGLACFPSRRAAFRAAKKDARVPAAQRPHRVDSVPMTNKGKPVLDSSGRPVMTREYHFKSNDGADIVIQEHSAGHKFGEGGVGDQGPHFNVRPADNPRTGSVPGTKDHYSWDSG